MAQESIYINRELSWLQFNERVLEEAEDVRVPLLERLKFISIFGSNLDEFFMIRVGSLFDQTLLNKQTVDNKSGWTPAEQLAAIYERTRQLLPRRDRAYHSILRALGGQGVTHIDLRNMSKYEEALTEAYFHREVLPLLSPQIVDKRHPFPFLRNKGIFVAAQVADKEGGDAGLCIIPIGAMLEPIAFFPAENGLSYLFMEELVLHYAGQSIRKLRMLDKALFRVTRNADIDVEEALYDQEMDFRDAMQELLRKRRKLAPVRLQVTGHGRNHGALIASLAAHLHLSAAAVFQEDAPLNPASVFTLLGRVEERKRKLLFPPLEPAPVPAPRSFGQWVQRLQRGDVLLAVPFQPVRPLISLLQQAADDPDVVSIKITLYRVAANSQIISALIEAAENGKEVLAVVELRARFDEENNIGWSRQLQDAGVTVIYGLDEYKVHSKLLLITRKNGKRVEYVTQVGTGNYNEKTAALYTDLMLITMNREIAADAVNVFNHLAIGELVEESRCLMVAPHCLKQRIIALIRREMEEAQQGRPARVIVKCNSVSDKELIDQLVAASQAGVPITLIVRGICCLKAGVPGYTENIAVRSIVGRYLEHSRIYVFGQGERQEVYISSADLMTRNTDRRVEVAAPIRDRGLQARLLEMIEILLRDNVKARVMNPDGSYSRVEQGNDEPLDSQPYFFRWMAEHPTRLRPPEGLPGRIRDAAGGLWGRLHPRR